MQKMSSHIVRHLQTSLHRLHQSRIVGRTEGRLKDIRAISFLETALKRLRSNRFLDAQDAENEVAWPFDTFKHRFIDKNVVFLRLPEGRL
jgi:hypothetical protein